MAPKISVNVVVMVAVDALNSQLYQALYRAQTGLRLLTPKN